MVRCANGKERSLLTTTAPAEEVTSQEREDDESRDCDEFKNLFSTRTLILWKLLDFELNCLIILSSIFISLITNQIEFYIFAKRLERLIDVLVSFRRHREKRNVVFFR